MHRHRRLVARFVLLFVVGVASLPAWADVVAEEQARGRAAIAAGDHQAGADALTKALMRARKERGNDDPSIGPLAIEAGQALLDAHDTKRATAAFSIAVKNAQDVHGKSSIEVAEPIRLLADAARRNGDTEKARTYHKHHIKLLERVTGKGSLRTAAALVDAADLDIRTKQFSQARTRLRSAIDVFKKAGGSSTPDLAAAQMRMGSAYMLDPKNPFDNFTEGRRFIGKAVDTYEGHFPKGSQEIIEVYEALLAEIAGSPIEEKLGGELNERLDGHRSASAAD